MKFLICCLFKKNFTFLLYELKFQVSISFKKERQEKRFFSILTKLNLKNEEIDGSKETRING
jgi:hypothetical protein